MNIFTGNLDLKGTSTAGSIQTMTTAQRIAATPTAGTVVYDTDIEAIFSANGSVWTQVGQ